MKRIYLDNAATSYPPVRGVREAVFSAMTRGNPGRSGHALSLAAAKTVFDTRSVLAELFGTTPDRVIFTSGATAALNQAIFGCFDGGTVVSDVFAHNAVIRPLAFLSAQTGVKIQYFTPAPDSEEETVSRFEAALDPSVGMVVLNAASNICGATLPVAKIGDVCRKKGILFILDGAQYAGRFACDLEKDGVDILCVPGHKGLQGMMGCGAMILSPACKKIPRPVLFGGSGSFSKDTNMPASLPDRLEAGTLPLPAIAALGAGVRYITAAGMHKIAFREEELGRMAAENLRMLPGITVYPYVGSTFVFSHRDFPAEDIAARLDEYGICVRAGFHCAPLAHRLLGTPPDGAVRVSIGAKNSERDIEYFLCAARCICGK